MNRRFVNLVLVLLAIFLGGGAIAAIAYSAGASTAVGTATGPGPNWGYAGHFGWGLWFLFPIFFLVLLFVLLRAAFGGWGYRGRGWGSGPRHWDEGPHGPGSDDPWTSRREAAFDEWHRRAHGGGGTGGPTPDPDQRAR